MEDDGVAYNIYLLLKHSDRPLSINELSKMVGMDWHTVKKRLEILLENNVVFFRKIGNNNLFWTCEF